MGGEFKFFKLWMEMGVEQFFAFGGIRDRCVMCVVCVVYGLESGNVGGETLDERWQELIEICPKLGQHSR